MSDVVDERVTAGRRVAELLASEIDGRTDASFEWLSVRNADRSVEPTADGSHTFDIARTDTVLGRVHIHPTRARLEITAGRPAARDALEATELQYRATGGPVPTVLIFLPDGVAVKRVLPVLRAAGSDVSEE